MERMGSTRRRLVNCFGVAAVLIVLALPAAAKSNPKASQPATVTQPETASAESIQRAAKQLIRQASLLPDVTESETLRLEIVDGKFFRGTLDQIAWLARECERRVADDKIHEKAGVPHPQLKGLRKVRNEVFNLRTNAMRVWLPTSHGCCSYMVDMRTLRGLCNRTARLSQEVFGASPGNRAVRENSAPKAAVIRGARRITSLTW